MLTSLVPEAKLTWDAERQRAMVIATPKDQQRVRETIEQIAQDAGPAEPRVLRLYTLDALQQSRFEAVEPDLLKDLPGVRVVKDPQTGELAVWAKVSQHEQLATLLDQLKAVGDPLAKRILVGYPIETSSVDTVFEMLQPVFPGITFTLDKKASRIYAYATLSEQGRIKQTVSQMDVPGTSGNREELRSYATGDANPNSITPDAADACYPTCN